ncbi:MAG: hypothetical protein PWQ30_1354 [Euryarchaeota archaeon]|jgi:hypothetical protein|nr:hypothetical protein [Euryarchaeota archaeon]
MTAPRSTLDYLDDILDAIEKIEIFTLGMSYEEFSEDDKTVYAGTGSDRGGDEVHPPIGQGELSRKPLDRDGRYARQTDPCLLRDQQGDHLEDNP